VSTVFLGTSAFAATILERLAADERDRPAFVLTRPDRPRGRGRKLASPPVAQAARALGLTLAQPASVNDEGTLAAIDSVRPDAVVVCAFGALIKKPLLTAYELLNVHPSLLPRWRGAAPIERAIIAGDERTGVSILRLTAGLDSGPVCLLGEESIEPHDTYGSLAPRLAELGSALLARALDAKASGEELPFVEQDERAATYAEKIDASDRTLDPRRPASELERVVRALHPHVGARAELASGALLGVHQAMLASDTDLVGLEGGVRGVLEHDGRLLLACAEGALVLAVVQPPGGRAMSGEAYLRGHGLAARR
jgi:methionyl-tRNA formyltransferase